MRLGNELRPLAAWPSPTSVETTPRHVDPSMDPFPSGMASLTPCMSIRASGLSA
jgi:hypothetical protein